jgi:hypothetical protein
MFFDLFVEIIPLFIYRDLSISKGSPIAIILGILGYAKFFYQPI